MSYQGYDGHTARSDELHRHILRSHLAYLNQEETPAKLQQRHNLESLISDFLCIVSHGAKFTFFEITKILNDSIENNANFSAYKAGSAFEALEKYATNLINHPWRKEYKTVKLYSGFYKHSVESQLLGGSAVFHLLGYQFSDDGVLYLDEPIDPDKVARVALDCLIAYVECQIMLQICERVKSFKCSWYEINQVRQDYVCSIDETVRILHQLKRNTAEQEKQDRWLREQENGVIREEKLFNKPDSGSNYQKTGILVDVSNTWPSNSTYNEYTSNGLILQPTVASTSYPTKSHKSSELLHPKLSSWSEGVPSQSRDCHSFISKCDETDGYASRSLDDYIQPNFNYSSKPHNSRYTNSDLTPDSWKDAWECLQPSPYHNSSYLNCEPDDHGNGHNHIVPNVKDAYASHFGHMYPPHPMMPVALPSYSHDLSLHPRQCPCQMCSDLQMPILPHKYYIGNDYDSTRRTSSRSEANHVDPPSELCSSFSKMSVDSSSSNPSTSKSRHFPVATTHNSYQSTNLSGGDVNLRTTSGNKPASSKRGSYYDNVPSSPFEDEISSFSVVGQSLTPKCDFQTNGTLPSASKSRNQKAVNDVASNSLSSKPAVKKSYSNSSAAEHLQVVGLTSSPEAKNSKSPLSGTQKDSKNSKKWSCSSCTYYNAPEKSICDMCGRSKNPGPEITPLVSGGRECPQCTLVNKKDCEDCTACGASLKDSPTYI